MINWGRPLPTMINFWPWNWQALFGLRSPGQVIRRYRQMRNHLRGQHKTDSLQSKLQARGNSPMKRNGSCKKSPAGILRPMCDSHKHDSVSLFWRFWFLSTHLLFILEGFQGMTNPTKIHKQIGIGKNIITGKSKVRKCCRWYFMLTIVMVVVMMEQVVIMVSSWTC